METKEQAISELDKIIMGLEETYRKLVLFKKEKKSPFIVSIDGKVVAIDAKQIDGDWIVHLVGGKVPTELNLFDWARQMSILS